MQQIGRWATNGHHTQNGKLTASWAQLPDSCPAAPQDTKVCVFAPCREVFQGSSHCYNYTGSCNCLAAPPLSEPPCQHSSPASCCLLFKTPNMAGATCPKYRSQCGLKLRTLQTKSQLGEWNSQLVLSSSLAPGDVATCSCTSGFEGKMR